MTTRTLKLIKRNAGIEFPYGEKKPIADELVKRRSCTRYHAFVVAHRYLRFVNSLNAKTS